MSSLDILSCDISRTVDQRVLIDKRKAKALFDLVKKAYNYSLQQGRDDEVRFLAGAGRPSVKLVLTDGSTFQNFDIDIIDKVETDQHRTIKELSIRSVYGVFSASVIMNSTYSLSSGNRITVQGPEDQARHLMTSIERSLREERDITTFVYKIPPMLFGITLSFILFGNAGYQFIVDNNSLVQSSVFAKSLSIVGVIFVMGMMLSIPFEIYKGRRVLSAAFLWGEDLNRHKITKSICYLVAVSAPVGVAINLLTTFIGG